MLCEAAKSNLITFSDFRLFLVLLIWKKTSARKRLYPPYIKAETKIELKRSALDRTSTGFCNEPLLGAKRLFWLSPRLWDSFPLPYMCLAYSLKRVSNLTPFVILVCIRNTAEQKSVFGFPKCFMPVKKKRRQRQPLGMWNSLHRDFVLCRVTKWVWDNRAKLTSGKAPSYLSRIA